MIASSQALDLTACDREPIHVLGAIQPHGLLVTLDGPDLAVVQASANVAEALSIPDPVGLRLPALLPELAAILADDVGDRIDLDAGATFLRAVTIPTSAGPRAYEAAAHRSGALTVLELEEVPAGAPGLDPALLYPQLRAFVAALEDAGTVEAICERAAAEVRRLTAFDRVLVYRFDEGWNGTVVAEDRNAHLPSYLDLRFPASDIPAQARELYRRNRVRIIPDAGYRPVPIVPETTPGTGQPLDLSHSILRSVSPVHVEYMRNMGTMASMSISILVDGALWGLVSCHNREPHRVSLQVRQACDLLTQMLAVQVAARERAAQADHRIRLGVIQTRLLGRMAEEERFTDGLMRDPEDVLALARAGGAAFVVGDECRLVGDTPAEDEVQGLHRWLAERRPADEVYATDALARDYPPAEGFADRASGLLAISISGRHVSHLLWFRPEVVRTVRWGGDPSKPATPDPAGGPARLHPRRSFEIWKETVRGRSAPWAAAEIAAAKDLRNAVLGIVLRRAEELAAISEELQRSNKELEAFSYSVSHDLRAPFRHIVGYSELLRAQEGDRLTDKGRRYVDTIIESAFAAGTLVDSLLAFAQMGRNALKRVDIDMNALVAEVRRRLEREVEPRRAIRWEVGPLPRVHADPVMMRLVIENLLSNAVKYTRGRDESVIAVEARQEPGETTFVVRDNGVGFDMAYVGKLFGVFQRLHRVEEFEGTGIGLANVRRIVERHGGRTWAEGAIDRGAAFHFTLPNRRGGTRP